MYLTIRWSYVIIIFFVSGYVTVVLAEQLMAKYFYVFPSELHAVLVGSFIYVLGYLGIKQEPVYLNMLEDDSLKSEFGTISKNETGEAPKEKYLKNKLDDEVKISMKNN